MDLKQKIISFEEAVKIFQVSVPQFSLPAEEGDQDIDSLTVAFKEACEDRLTLLSLFYNFIDNIDEGLKENGDDPIAFEVICSGTTANSYLKFQSGKGVCCDPSIEIDHELADEETKSFPIFLLYLVVGEIGSDDEHSVTIIQTIDIEDFQSAIFVSCEDEDLENFFSGDEMQELPEKNQHVINALIQLLSYQSDKYEVKVEVIEASN